MSSENALQTGSHGGDAGGDTGGDDLLLSDAISEAYDELFSGDVDDDDFISGESEAYDDDQTIEDSSDDESGADSQDEDSGEDTSEEGDQDDEEGQDDDDSEVGAGDIPSDLTKEEKAAFAKLDEGGKALVSSYALRSQQSRSKVATELDGLKPMIPIAEELEKYNPYFEQLGVSAPDVLKSMMPYYANLALGDDKQREGAVRMLAQQFKVNLATTKTNDADDDPNAYVDPVVSELKQQVEDLNSKLDYQDRSLQTGIQEQAKAKAIDMVEVFKAAKDDKGDLKHPHFELVEQEMSKLVQSGVAKGLDDAYSMAIKINDKAQAAINKAAKLKADKVADEKAKKAKKAAKVNKAATNDAAKNNAIVDARTAVSDAWDELAGI